MALYFWVVPRLFFTARAYKTGDMLEEYKEYNKEASPDLSSSESNASSEYGDQLATESILGGLGIEACRLEVSQFSCDTFGSRDRVHPKLQVIYGSSGLLFALGRYRT